MAMAMSVLVVTGCSAGSESATQAPASSGVVPGSARPTPSDRPRHEPVLAAYQGFIDAFNTATAAGDPTHPELSKYTDGHALIEVREAIRRDKTLGRHYLAGMRVVSAQVTGADLDARPPQSVVTVTACIDTSYYIQIDADGQKPVSTSRETIRFVTTSDLWRTNDGAWVVMTVEPQRDEEC